MEILSKTQEDRLLADKQLELLRDAREAGKQAYEDAHLAYMALVQKRRAELLEMLFGKTADIDPSALISLSVAGEDALLNMAQIAATSGNEGLAQAVLLSAYERDLDVIHSLIRILAGGDPEDDEGDEDESGLAALFSELFEIDQEQVTDDVNVLGEELKVRFDRLVPNPSLEDLMPGSPKRAILLGG